MPKLQGWTGSERSHGKALMAAVGLHLRTYPELELFYHIPNELPASAAEMAEIRAGGGYPNSRWRASRLRQISDLKAQGLRKGIPDYHLAVARGGYWSLYLELKTPQGRLGPEQRAMIDRLRRAGHAVAVTYDWHEAWQVLQWYLNLPPPPPSSPTSERPAALGG